MRADKNSRDPPRLPRPLPKRSLTYEDYTVGWICALDIELAAAMAVIDEEHPPLPQNKSDYNSYILCRICNHNVVLASLPLGQIGNNSAASVATRMTLTFPSLRFGVMVGIGGGVPSTLDDIRLGDVVVSKPGTRGGGVVQYDFGAIVEQGKFIHRYILNAPPKVVLTALNTIKARHRFGRFGFLEYLSQIPPKLGSSFSYLGAKRDRLFEVGYEHERNAVDCTSCDVNKLVRRSLRRNSNPIVHYGTIASGNSLMAHGASRERLRGEHKILCFEMEAAGLMNEFPCIVIRGISDYCDSHKNKEWQPYASATAAAYAKELLSTIATEETACLGPFIAPSSRRDINSSSILTVLHPPPSESRSSGDFNQSQEGLYGRDTTRNSKFRTSDNSLVLFLTSTFTIMTDSFLPWNRAALGCLVLSLNDPGQDYCPHISLGISPDEICVKNFQNISDIIDFKSGSRLSKSIKTFISGKIEKEERPVYDLTALGVVTQQLLNPGAVFERMIQDEQTKRWIEKLQGKGVYLIVGIHVLLNFELNVGFGGERSLNSSDFGYQRGRSNDKFPTIGDQIVGVEYRRVRVEEYDSATVDSSSLGEKSWWRKYYHHDVPHTADNLEVDILKVELEKSPSVADIRDDVPGEYEIDVYHSVMTGESFVFLVIDHAAEC